jgi:hypothetical protein
MSSSFPPDTTLGATTGDGLTRYDENLSTMAAQAYDLASCLCGHCRTYHSIWPYRRLALDAGQGGVRSVGQALAACIASNARRVLIAGTADTGSLATIARASAGHDIEITLVDRCPTPVELCRRFADRCALRFQSCICDLAELDVQGFDVAFANSVLPFIPASKRIDVLVRLRQGLRPGGLLVLVYNAATSIASPAGRKSHADVMLAELDRKGIRLPDSVNAFRERICEYEQELYDREREFNDPTFVDNLVRASGFVLKNRQELDVPLGIQKFTPGLSKRRYLSVWQTPEA